MNCEGLSCSLKCQLSPPVMIPLLDCPPLRSAHPSHLCLNGERNRQAFSAGRGSQQWIKPSLPQWSLFTTCPCTLTPFSHYLPHSNPMVPRERSLPIHPCNNLLIVIMVLPS